MKKLLIIAISISAIFFFFYNPNVQNTIFYSDKLITDNMSEMIPSLIADPKIEESNDNYIRVSYLFYFGFDVMELKCEINKFPTIEDAEGNYSSTKQQYSDYKSVNIGNEGFGIEKNSVSIVVFRKTNVVVKTELDGKYSSLDQTINYARKVII